MGYLWWAVVVQKAGHHNCAVCREVQSVRFRVHSPLFLHVLHIGQPKKIKPKNPNPKIKKKGKKSHPHPKKSPPTLKSQKKIRKKKNLGGGSFCYKNVDKMFYYLQKVIFSLQKVKKVKKVKKSKKKIFLIFFHILCKKHTVFNHFWFWAPYPPM